MIDGVLTIHTLTTILHHRIGIARLSQIIEKYSITVKYHGRMVLRDLLKSMDYKKGSVSWKKTKKK